MLVSDIHYLRDKIDKIDDKLAAIGVTLTQNTSSLEEHIRRTNILEQEIRPIKSHVALMNTGAKILVGTGGLIITLLGAAKTLGLI